MSKILAGAVLSAVTLVNATAAVPQLTPPTVVRPPTTSPVSTPTRAPTATPSPTPTPAPWTLPPPRFIATPTVVPGQLGGVAPGANLTTPNFNLRLHGPEVVPASPPLVIPGGGVQVTYPANMAKSGKPDPARPAENIESQRP